MASPAPPARKLRPRWSSSFMWPITSSMAARRLISQRMVGMMPRVWPVANALDELGVPFVFETGYGPGCNIGKYVTAPVLHKPFDS